MKGLVFALAILASFTVNAAPVDFSFTGNLADVSDHQLFDFTVSTTSDVTLRTLSYGGGTNADGVAISNGGFDPILTLFDSSGAFVTHNDDGDAHVSADPATGATYDAFIKTTLSPGDYTAALTMYSNFAAGSKLADGFQFTGQVPSDFGNRTSFWAVDIIGVDKATVVPIPAAVWLFGTGLMGLLGMRAKVSMRST